MLKPYILERDGEQMEVEILANGLPEVLMIICAFEIDGEVDIFEAEEEPREELEFDPINN